jgi:hypothetical protein
LSDAVPSEHAEQVALMRWARLWSAHVPELALLFAIPNGGQRHKIVAARLRAEGVQAGVPDLFLPVARRDRHGLFIELKRSAGGRLSPAQKAVNDRLRAQGYEVRVAHGWDEARVVLCAYLAINLTRGADGALPNQGANP